MAEETLAERSLRKKIAELMGGDPQLAQGGGAQAGGLVAVAPGAFGGLGAVAPGAFGGLGAAGQAIADNQAQNAPRNAGAAIQGAQLPMPGNQQAPAQGINLNDFQAPDLGGILQRGMDRARGIVPRINLPLPEAQPWPPPLGARPAGGQDAPLPAPFNPPPLGARPAGGQDVLEFPDLGRMLGNAFNAGNAARLQPPVANDWNDPIHHAVDPITGNLVRVERPGQLVHRAIDPITGGLVDPNQGQQPVPGVNLPAQTTNASGDWQDEPASPWRNLLSGLTGTGSRLVDTLSGPASLIPTRNENPIQAVPQRPTYQTTDPNTGATVNLPIPLGMMVDSRRPGQLIADTPINRMDEVIQRVGNRPVLRREGHLFGGLASETDLADFAGQTEMHNRLLAEAVRAHGDAMVNQLGFANLGLNTETQRAERRRADDIAYGIGGRPGAIDNAAMNAWTNHDAGIRQENQQILDVWTQAWNALPQTMTGPQRMAELQRRNYRIPAALGGPTVTRTLPPGYPGGGMGVQGQPPNAAGGGVQLPPVGVGAPAVNARGPLDPNVALTAPAGTVDANIERAFAAQDTNHPMNATNAGRAYPTYSRTAFGPLLGHHASFDAITNIMSNIDDSTLRAAAPRIIERLQTNYGDNAVRDWEQTAASDNVFNDLLSRSHQSQARRLLRATGRRTPSVGTEHGQGFFMDTALIPARIANWATGNSSDVQSEAMREVMMQQILRMQQSGQLPR